MLSILILHLQIKCTRCESKSERIERILDLTVEISGDIETIEEALQQYTSTEILDGDNRYQCSRLIDRFIYLYCVQREHLFPVIIRFSFLSRVSFSIYIRSILLFSSSLYLFVILISFRCKSYVKAKKRLSILEAPNILTIALKRFQVFPQLIVI